MKYPRVFCAFFAVAVAAVFAFVSPSEALAETYDISDADASGGCITLREGNSTYNVASDLHYPVKTYGDNIVVDFNGHKLELPADSTSAAIEDVNTTFIGTPTCTINDAVIINNGSGVGIYTNKSYFTANNCSVTTQDNYCIKVTTNLLAINGGTYERKAGTGALAYVWTNDHSGQDCGLLIGSGSFTAPEGSPMVELNYQNCNPYVRITGGSFSYPDAARFLEGRALLKDGDGRWTVTDNDTASQSAYCYVQLNYEHCGYYPSGRVYFGAGEQEAAAANELADKYGAKVTDVTRKVTFDADGGSPAPTAQDVARGKTATEPAVPHKVGCKFAQWLNKATSAAFSFDTPITDNVELVASYQQMNTCRITFDTGEGKFPSGRSYETQVAYDSTASGCEPSEKPELAGKLFDYWSANGTDPYDFGSAVTSDVTLKAVWKNAVAECDGVYYGSLSDAFDAVKGTTGKTVKLLGNVTECASVSGATDLTLDLGGFTVTAPEHRIALSVGSCSGLTIKNGRVEATKASGLYIAGSDNLVMDNVSVDVVDEDETGIMLGKCDNFKLVSMNVTVSGVDSDGLSLYQASGTVSGGSFEGTNGARGILVAGGDVTISGATVTGEKYAKEGAPAQAINYLGTKLTIADGTFNDCLAEFVFPPDGDDDDDEGYGDGYMPDFPPSTISIEGGSFGAPDNAASVVSGKCLLKRANGKYEVVSQDAAQSAAQAWVDLADARVWYESASEAASYAKQRSAYEGSSLAETYSVATFVSQDNIVMTGYVRKGGSLNFLPEGEQVSGYTFDGWYVGESKKDASFVPEGDVTLTAMWVKQGGEDPVGPTPSPSPTPSPTPNPGPAPSDDSGSNEQSGSQKGDAIPATGDDSFAFGAVLAAGVSFIVAGGALRRRNSQ